MNNSFFTSILLLGVVPVFYLIKKILGSVKKIVELVNWFKMKYFKKYDYKDSLGIIGKLDSDLANLTKVFSRVNRKKGPIIIFIDDLDRCPPNRVVEVINAINTLTLSKGFIFFLGYDRKYVASAICAEYKEMIGI